MFHGLEKNHRCLFSTSFFKDTTCDFERFRRQKCTWTGCLCCEYCRLLKSLCRSLAETPRWVSFEQPFRPYSVVCKILDMVHYYLILGIQKFETSGIHLTQGSLLSLQYWLENCRHLIEDSRCLEST